IPLPLPTTKERGDGRGGGVLFAVLRKLSAFALPNHMQNDLFKSRIPIMPVRPPAAGPQIHLHVPSPRRPIPDLHHRAPEIRPPPTPPHPLAPRPPSTPPVRAAPSPICTTAPRKSARPRRSESRDGAPAP